MSGHAILIMSHRDTEEAILSDKYHPLYNPFRAKPLLAKKYDDRGNPLSSISAE